MAKFSAVFDACVLHPAPLRDVLLRLALADLYKANWTHMIHEDWINEARMDATEQSADICEEDLRKISALMDQSVRDSLVTGFEHLIDGLNLPRLRERHVLAAAIRCNADAIVTKNLDNYPQDVLDTYGIETIHPDDFIYLQIDMEPAKCCHVFQQQRTALKAPEMSVDIFLNTLLKQALPQTVSKLKEYYPLL